jgi:hypothetical protein
VHGDQVFAGAASDLRSRIAPSMNGRDLRREAKAGAGMGLLK